MEENNQVTELQIIQAKQAAEFAMTPVGQTVKQFEVMQRMANMYTTSTIVPDTYKGNVGNCVIALDMAMRMGCNPLMCMQNLYIVHGNPAFSSKFLIATINASGRFSPLRYEFKGEEGTPEYGCRCIAYESSDKDHKEPLHGDWITMGMAEKEGWTKKNGSKWQSMPSQMLRYRAAAFWQRVYCPEISMGLITKEEADDIQDAEYSSAHTRENLGDISSETFDMDLDKCFADLKSEEGWLRDAWERAYRNGFRNFTLDECKDKYVDLYYWKLKGEGVTHKSVSDAKRHFSNWLITELKKQKDDRARTKTFSRATTDPTGKVICGETETGTDIQSGGASQKDYSARF